MKNGHHITIRDIAEKAGCSIGTVDRVIHNRGRVSQPLKERILRIIKELDYKPNVNARVLASKQPLTLGLLLPAFRKGEYWELPNLGILEAVERYEEQGYHINVQRFTFNNPERFVSAGMKLIADGIDGIIMAPASHKESVTLVRAYFQNNTPFILIDSDIHGIPSLSFIGKDPVQSGRTVGRLIHQITKHIQGQKKIWIINLSRNLHQMYALLSRESGLMDYYADKRLQGEYVFQSFDIEDKGSQKHIDLQTETMIKQGVPHAIYVTGSRVHLIANSLKKLKLEPKPLLVGHDLIKSNMQRVKDESIDLLIEEEAKRQGYLAVESMIRSVVHKEEIAKKQFMKFLIYTPENLPLDPLE